MSAIELGRRLRLGAREAEPEEGLDAGALEAAALALLDAVDPAHMAAAVQARDDAESLLVVLGHLDAVDAERRVLARATEVDARVLACRDEWGATAVKPADPWLARIAAVDASAWWLDLVALGALRERAKAFDPAFAFRDGPRPSAMRLVRSVKSAPVQAYAEVVGMEDDPARVAIERGAVIARMFDGEVEVFALGLRADQDDVPAGLCVARKGGGVADIHHVALGGTLGGKSHSGWWTPITENGAASLVVRLADREESLLLDIAH